MRIYILDDPRTGEVRYVGQTKYITKRYMQHIYNCDKNNLDKHDWIAELKALGLFPGHRVVEDDVAWDDRFKRESYWMRYYLSLGHRLTNQLEPQSVEAREEELGWCEQVRLRKLMEDM